MPTQYYESVNPSLILIVNLYALNVLQGETNRAIAAHTLNKQSSRSHCIFIVYLEVSRRIASLR